MNAIADGVKLSLQDALPNIRKRKDVWTWIFRIFRIFRIVLRMYTRGKYGRLLSQRGYSEARRFHIPGKRGLGPVVENTRAKRGTRDCHTTKCSHCDLEIVYQWDVVEHYDQRGFFILGFQLRFCCNFDVPKNIIWI